MQAHRVIFPLDSPTFIRLLPLATSSEMITDIYHKKDDVTNRDWQRKRTIDSEESDVVHQVNGIRSIGLVSDEFSRLFAILHFRRYHLDVSTGCKTHIDMSHFGPNDFYLVGTISGSFDAIQRVFQKYDIEAIPCRPKLDEYLWSYKPDLYQAMTTCDKSVKYKCSRSCNRPTTSPDGPIREYVNIKDPAFSKLWAKLDE